MTKIIQKSNSKVFCFRCFETLPSKKMANYEICKECLIDYNTKSKCKLCDKSMKKGELLLDSYCKICYSTQLDLYDRNYIEYESPEPYETYNNIDDTYIEICSDNKSKSWEECIMSWLQFECCK